jgi:type IV secretory pathway VirB2 component (pilin)
MEVIQCKIPQFSRSKQTSKRFLKKGFLTVATYMAVADEVFAQSTTSPWTQAVQALQSALTGRTPMPPNLHPEELQ